MSGDNSFFAELQTEFLNESAFLLETFEESMLGLEGGTGAEEHLSQIFRVAHSIKGGAAAVGLTDLSKFAHVAEDLLAILRNQPDLVTSPIISLLLKSGDELKKRIFSLRNGEETPWDPSSLVKQLVQVSEELTGKQPKTSSSSNATHEETKLEVPDDFFLNINEAILKESGNSAAKAALAVAESGQVEDVANLELLEELLSQLPPEEAEAYRRNNGLSVAPNTSIKSAEVEDQTAAAKETQVEPIHVATENVKTAASSNSSASATAAGGGSASSAGGGSSKPPASGAVTKTSNKASASIKVDTGRVDSVLDAVGELVVLKNQLVHDEYIKSGGNIRLEAIVDQLDKSVRELYEKTLSIRMTPLKSLFIKIQRIVRDVSLSLNKPVDLVLIGEETEVERTVFELLNDPLVHLVRNAMDHGVERPETRASKGKAPIAKVTVSAKQSGGNVLIEISDDGAGINRKRILDKAIEKGLVPTGVDVNSISDDQVFQFIFAPGFSTAEKVTDLSGRGVGMDVVKSNLDKINGKIHISSKENVGSIFRLTIPLSTAITDGILVSIDGARYILPIHSIREIIRAVPEDYTEISGSGKVVKIREALLPVINAKKILGEINWEGVFRNNSINRNDDSLSARRGETMLLIMESMMQQMAFPVDDVIGQAQVVVKPIIGSNIPEVAGAAIMGDGRTVLILDPNAIVQTASRTAEDSARETAA